MTKTTHLCCLYKNTHICANELVKQFYRIGFSNKKFPNFALKHSLVVKSKIYQSNYSGYSEKKKTTYKMGRGGCVCAKTRIAGNQQMQEYRWLHLCATQGGHAVVQ